MPVLIRPASVALAAAALAAAAATSFTLEDITAGGSLHCGSSAAKVRLKSGKGLSGANAGKLTAGSVSGCGAAGFTVTIKAAHLPWQLSLVSYNSAKGVTTATLTGIQLTLAVPGTGCTGVVDGTAGTAGNGMVRVTYTNKTATLTTLKTGGKLRLYDVRNCYGLVSNGDSVAISASYAVRPAPKITSR